MMISDVRMPGLSGLETLRRVRREHAALPVLLVTAYADIRDAVVAMRDGAVNYLAKPIDLDELLDSVQQATGIAKSAPLRYSEDKRLPPRRDGAQPAHGGVVSGRFVDCAVGNARPDHRRKRRRQGSRGGRDSRVEFARRRPAGQGKLRCDSRNAARSELFGHEKGSFTGAHAQRIGRFEEADGGTIFLDEIAEMSPALQAKLLRVTQDGGFQRVGSNREVRTNARILAASNRNLEEEVKAGRFREDLYYRLNVVELNIPPLRERREDILPLANLFIGGICQGPRAVFRRG